MIDARSTPRRRRVKFTDRQLTVLTELYENGLNDPEIAKKFGVNREVIKYQRHKLGLFHLRLFTDQELIDLHETGLNDREMADRLGASEALVYYHRRRLGIESNRSITWGRKFTDGQIVALHERGLNDREIADELGVKKRSINYYRRKLGLESNYASVARARS